MSAAATTTTSLIAVIVLLHMLFLGAAAAAVCDGRRCCSSFPLLPPSSYTTAAAFLSWPWSSTHYCKQWISHSLKGQRRRRVQSSICIRCTGTPPPPPSTSPPSTTPGVHADLPSPFSSTLSTTNNAALVDRRACFHVLLVAATCTTTIVAANSFPAYAAAAAAASIYSREQVIELLQNAIDTLQTLLDNWTKAVIDCTYADVSRDLLETKNKELLLEKASTFALFDKSGSVVISCKTTNRIIRDYLGLTGKGPLVGVLKLVKNGMNHLIIDDDDDNDLELYIESMEELERAMARASSYSYSAGTIADVNAIQNFDPAEQDKVLASNDNANLRQTKQAIQESLIELQTLVAILKKKGETKPSLSS